jgi:hypothetical protein
VHTGTYVEASRLTLQAFLEEQWLPTIKASLREGTHESYKRTVRVHVVPQLGTAALQSLTAAQLNAF